MIVFNEEIDRRLRVFESAERNLAEAKARFNSAECTLANAQNALGKILAPDDAAVGETFNVWIGDGLLSIHVDGNAANREYTIHWRQKRTPGSDR